MFSQNNNKTIKMKNVMFKYQLLVMIFIFFSCEKTEKPEKPDIISDYFMGQSAPGITPIRFASDIITDNFYPHSRLIISPGHDRINWTTFLDLISSEYELFYADFNGENISGAKKDTILAKYGILGFTWINESKIIFGSQQPYETMDNRLIRAVWTSEKTESGWNKPQAIEVTVDTSWASLGSVTVNFAGDIYFSGRMEGETAKIYCTKNVNGIYQKFEALTEIINSGITIDPFIDYQDRYLLFSAANRNDNIGIIDLYISFKDELGVWSQPTNLGQEISTEYIDRFPMVTNDGKYLFFVTSNSDHFPSTFTHFYWVDAQVLNNLSY